MSRPEVDAVVFDVNETLFSLERLRPAFGDIGLEAALVPLWFAGLLRDGFALTAQGGYRPFAEVAAETLRRLDERVDEASVAALMAAMRELQPHPDVEPALQALRARGVPVATLTNGGVEVVRALLDRAGLADLVARNLSVDAVQRGNRRRSPTGTPPLNSASPPSGWCWSPPTRGTAPERKQPACPRPGSTVLTLAGPRCSRHLMSPERT